jgi:hypothetical protein
MVLKAFNIAIIAPKNYRCENNFDVLEKQEN